MDAYLVLVVLTASVLAPEIWLNRHKLKKYIQSEQSILIGGGFLLITVLVVLFHLINPAAKVSNSAYRQQLRESSVALFDFITPAHLVIDEPTAYVGFGLIILLILGIRVLKKREEQFWLWMSCVFFLFSLGPFLIIGNRVRPLIPLPYAFLTHFYPWQKLFNNPGLFYVIVIFSIIVVAGFTLKYFLQKKETATIIIISGFFLLALIEVPLLPASFQRLSFIDTCKALEQIPLDDSDYILDYRQQKFDADLSKNLKIYVADRYTELSLQSEETAPQHSVVAWRIVGDVEEDVLPDLSRQLYTAIANEEGIAYVVVSKYDSDYQNRLMRVQQIIDVEEYSSNDEVIVLEIMDRHSVEPYMQLNENWSDPRQTRKAENVYRWARSGAELVLRNYQPNPTAMQITFDTRKEQRVSFNINGQQVSTKNFSVGKHTVDFEVPSIATGDVYLKFEMRQKVKVFQIDLIE
ncbi:hypothetical protein ACFL2M_01480 [Patescibacteria group bacterium]